MLLLHRLTKDFIGLLFPELCNGCNGPLFHGEIHLCTLCLFDLPYTDFHKNPANLVAKLFWGRLSCQAAMSMLYYRKGSRVQHMIHRLKYKHQTSLGLTLGHLLGEKLTESAGYKDIDLLLPVPLHPTRERERGFNQSKYIADGIAQVLRVPVCTKHLKRHKTTGTQTKKSRYERFENMQNVFGLQDQDKSKGKHVLLVDDVITTGSTLESCGALLFKNEISTLSIATVAYVV